MDNRGIICSIPPLDDHYIISQQPRVEAVHFAAKLGWRRIDEVIRNTHGAVMGWLLRSGIKRMWDKADAKT